MFFYLGKSVTFKKSENKTKVEEPLKPKRKIKLDPIKWYSVPKIRKNIIDVPLSNVFKWKKESKKRAIVFSDETNMDNTINRTIVMKYCVDLYIQQIIIKTLIFYPLLKAITAISSK